MTFKYKCALCGVERTITVQDGPQFEQFDKTLAPGFLKVMYCPKCYPFEATRRNLFGYIYRLLAKLSIARAGRPPAPSDKQQQKFMEACNEVRQGLVLNTKAYSRNLADFYHKPDAWEPQVVDNLMDNPTKANHILGVLRAAYVR